MKRRNVPAVLIGLVLIILLVCTAQAEEQLPEEIRGTFAGAEILNTAHWESPGGTWFVLARMPDGTNMLFCFELHNGSWIQAFHTGSAVPQGNTAVEYLQITDRLQDFVHDRMWPGPILLILTDDGGYTSYQRDESGRWLLFKVFCADEQIYLDFDEAAVIYRIPIDQDHSRFETVYGTFERDLKKVDLNRIPRSPQQARELLDSD